MLWDNYINRSITCFFCIVLMAFPLAEKINQSIIFGNYQFVLIFWCFCGLLCAGLLIPHFFQNIRPKVIHITLTDLWIICFFTIGVINAFYSCTSENDPVLYWTWGTVLMGYIFIRNNNINSHLILHVIVWAGILQAITVISQQIGIISSNQKIFKITGTFYNPGPLGGFLAMCTVISSGMVLEYRKKNKILAAIYIIAFFFNGYALVLADSRAAYLGLITGFLILFWNFLPKKIKYMHTITGFCLSALFFMLTIFLSYYRPDSAKARLLIWKVSVNMIEDKPITGHGIGSFKQKYMLYQADYFAKQPTSEYVQVADNVAYPYNEFIHIFVELGIIGAILLIILYVFLYLTPALNLSQRIIRGAFASLSVFGLFSYPSEVYTLLFLYFALIGLMHNKVLFSVSISSRLQIVLLTMPLLLSTVALADLKFYHSVSKIMNLFFSGSTKSANIFFKTYYEKLSQNKTFNYYWATYLQDNPSLEDLQKLPASCETYCTIGTHYTLDSLYNKAEEYYKIAHNMIPTRQRPLYLLWRLSIQQNDSLRAISQAKALLEQPLKTESSLNLKIKGEALLFLSQKSDNYKYHE